MAGIRSVPKISVCSLRFLSTTSEELFGVFTESENIVKREPDPEGTFEHPLLKLFEKENKDNPSVAYFTRHFGKDEIVSLQINHDDYEVDDEESEYEEDESEDESEEHESDSEYESDDEDINEIERFFKIKMTKPNKPSLEFHANVKESVQEVSILTIKVKSDSDASYLVNFDDLAEEEQGALLNYINERVSDDIGNFVLEYHDVMDRNLYLRWLKDVKNYVA